MTCSSSSSAVRSWILQFYEDISVYQEDSHRKGNEIGSSFHINKIWAHIRWVTTESEAVEACGVTESDFNANREVVT